MNWEAVGAVAELIGAVGVILSLVYLSLQIRQNSNNLEQNTAIARANAAVLSANYGADLIQAVAFDPELHRIWILGFAHPGELTAEEAARFDSLMTAQLIHIDVNYFLMGSGTLDPEVYAIWDRVLANWTRHPRFRAMWEDGRIERLTTTRFRALIAERLASQAGPTGAREAAE